MWVPNCSPFSAWYHWRAPLQVYQLKVQSCETPRTTNSPEGWVRCPSQLSSHPTPTSPGQTPAVKLHACRVLRIINFSKSLKEQKPWKRLMMPFMLLELLGGEIVILTLGWILKRDESHRLLSTLKTFSFSFSSFMFPSPVPTSPSSPKLLVEIWKAVHELLRS